MNRSKKRSLPKKSKTLKKHLKVVFRVNISLHFLKKIDIMDVKKTLQKNF